MQLPGGVQEPRPESDAGRNAGSGPDGVADAAQRSAGTGVAVQVGKQRDVIPFPRRSHVRAQHGGHPAAPRTPQQAPGVIGSGEQPDARLLQERLRSGKRPLGLVRRGQIARSDFCGLNVGLVEGIDAQNRPRNGRRDLPAKELLPEVLQLPDSDPDDGMA